LGGGKKKKRERGGTEDSPKCKLQIQKRKRELVTYLCSERKGKKRKEEKTVSHKKRGGKGKRGGLKLPSKTVKLFWVGKRKRRGRPRFPCQSYLLFNKKKRKKERILAMEPSPKTTLTAAQSQQLGGGGKKKKKRKGATMVWRSWMPANNIFDAFRKKKEGKEIRGPKRLQLTPEGKKKGKTEKSCNCSTRPAKKKRGGGEGERVPPRNCKKKNPKLGFNPGGGRKKKREEGEKKKIHHAGSMQSPSRNI